MKRHISKVHSILFRLLSSAIGTQPSESDISLSPEEWELLFRTAKQQEVLVLVMDEINRHKTNLSIQQRSKWTILAVQLKKRHSLQRQTISLLSDRLASVNIPMMLLKGHGFARFYPNPQLRECGDIDIYTMGHYQESNEYFLSLGIDVKPEDEKHCAFTFNGVDVENHLKMNYNINHANEVLGKEFKARFDSKPEEDPSIPGVLLPERNICALHMTMHTISHLAWSGISVRHLTDWTTFLEKSKDMLDFDYLDSVWKESGLAPVVGMITRMCKELLGCTFFPLEYGSLFTERDYRYLLSDILNPLKSPTEVKDMHKKFWIKTQRYFRHCRKHKLIYGEPFPDSYFQELGI